MTRPRLEVAEVIRDCRDAFLQRYGTGLRSEQRRALDDLTACRTAALGGHVLECPGCGHQLEAVVADRRTTSLDVSAEGDRACPGCGRRWTLAYSVSWREPSG